MGWAVSVNTPDHSHAGTLEFQFGVRGRAGFQGEGSSGTVRNSIGVRGEIYNDSAAATISNARAGEFISNSSIGTVENNCAIFAGAENGVLSNWSFYGVSGEFYNRDRARFGSEFAETLSKVVIRAPGNAFEFGFPDSGGYCSTLGSTALSGAPFLGFCCEAEGSGNTFTTRGRKGTVIYNDLSGNLVFARLPEANAVGQSLVQCGRFDDVGNLNLLANLAITGSALFGTGQQANSRVAIRQPGNNIEFGHPNPAGYGSNLGATTVSGLPFIAFNAEADNTGNTFTTRGRRGVVVSSDINGSLVFSRIVDANAGGQSLTQSARFDPEGRLILASLPTFNDNAAAVSASLVAGTVYRTEDGDLRVVV